MSKTLYISDLDGTLLNRNAELSQHAKDTLGRMIAEGLSFSVATARTADTALKILEGVRWTTPLVLLNGALIYDSLNKQFVQINTISKDTVTAVLKVFRCLNVTGLMYSVSNAERAVYYEAFCNKPVRDFIEERRVRYNKNFNCVDSFSDVTPRDIVYFTLLDTYDKVKPVSDAISEIPGINRILQKDIYSADLWFMEIYSEEASKRNAVAYLRETCGFDRIIGFGDGLNDLPMFAACDVSVATENANWQVKEAADFICGANTEDGAVKWIESDFNGKDG